MAFETHPVTKERWPGLVELFDRPIVRTCFCMYYRKTWNGPHAATHRGVGIMRRPILGGLINEYRIAA